MLRYTTRNEALRRALDDVGEPTVEVQALIDAIAAHGLKLPDKLVEHAAYYGPGNPVQAGQLSWEINRSKLPDLAALIATIRAEQSAGYSKKKPKTAPAPQPVEA